MKRCHRCGKEIVAEGTTSRRDTCPFCHADLHCCFQCAFYDPGAYNQCREPQAERVLEKERSNFCDYFRFADAPVRPASGGGTEKAKEKLEALFRK